MSIPATVQCRAVVNHVRCPLMTSETRYCPEHLALKWGVRVGDSPVGGRGLFAVRPFKKGENIVEYGGRLVIVLEDSSDEEDAPIYEGPYVLQIKKNHYIDAARTDSEGRYVNAAPRGKKNNAQLIYDRLNRKAWVRARDKIDPDDEIWAAYGAGYWKGLKKN